MKKLVTLSVMFGMSFSLGIASAQSTKPKTAKPKVKLKKPVPRSANPRARVNTTRQTPNPAQVGAALNANLDGGCFTLNDKVNDSKERFSATCGGTRTDKMGKRVDCTGYKRDDGSYKKYACQVHGISGNRHFEIRSRRGEVSMSETVEMACGCGRTDEMTCSGGLCYISE